MKKKILVTFLSLAFLIQLFFLFQDIYAQMNPVTVPRVEDATTSSNEANNDQETTISETLTPLSSYSQDSFTPNPASEYVFQNPDYVGWLTLNDTKIDYPVVRGRDNEFYLTHNFYKEKDVLGAIFMDHRNIGLGKDDHGIIYGHHSAYGHMFADLENFLTEDFLLAHPTFTFEDMYTERTYEIFSVHIAPADPYFIQTSFEEEELASYFQSLKEKSIVPLTAEATKDMKMLSLLTCNYVVDEGRLYVHAIETSGE
ncbi:class B sortase [Lacticigenium naphthae]|uniref:class B sortase n=1 Tax=Lacticigenium naphthae TaxID=515351 RepID=UPI0003FF5359|nr:class B sortase [Lacticigenium naphthae]